MRGGAPANVYYDLDRRAAHVLVPPHIIILYTGEGWRCYGGGEALPARFSAPGRPGLVYMRGRVSVRGSYVYVCAGPVPMPRRYLIRNGTKHGRDLFSRRRRLGGREAV